MDPLDRFTPPTRIWFEESFAAPTAAQRGGWEAIAGGDHTLIHAPTGSGKTLAAFLWSLDRLFGETTPPEQQRCRVLYVSPMKALAYDVERNLRAPLAGIRLAAARSGTDLPEITTALRTGDTPPDERRRMLRRPPDILITTPESLYLMLTSQAREVLAPVATVIVDEIHAVAGTKRGAHLALSLERLTTVTRTPPQRIGLSATQRPLEAIGAFLAGGDASGTERTPRPVTIIDAAGTRDLDVEIVVPVEDMTRPEDSPGIEPTTMFGATTPRRTDPNAPAPPPPRTRSIWPAVYPRLLDLVLQHRSTIIFANSRGLAERTAAQLNDIAGEDLVQAHHGSVSREQRLDIEDRLKRGDLRAVVATSSLELGIDMAAVDLVILIESPTSVARGLQRIGRAGHQVGAPSVARVFPKHRGDLLEAVVVVDRMFAGEIEETRIPRNPLDVLAQQIVAAVAVSEWDVDALFDLARGAANFADLGRTTFEAVLDMLAGRYPSDEFAELKPRIVWDRVAGTVQARSNARMLAVTNPGTIPDRGLYPVVLPGGGGRVGELDEEMVYESRPGDVFVLGSTTWRVSEITRDRVEVIPAPGVPAARMPFWKGDAPGRPLETGKALGAFVREIGALGSAAAIDLLTDRYRLDAFAAANLAQFVAEEKEAVGALPTDTTIVAERFRDEIGDWRIVLLSPFGSRIHAPWALAARSRYRDRHGLDVDVMWSDDGIILRFPDADEPPDPVELLIGPEEIEDLVVREVGESAVFTGTFREAAARALLLPRRRPGKRTPLWLQRRKGADLLAIAKRYASFPIVLEAYREVLQDRFDLPALTGVLADLQARRIRLVIADPSTASPFASSLMFGFIASFIYDYDAPVAERRATALTLDRELLRELLGEPELRDLLDPDVVAAVELELQWLDPARRARSADGVHDLLRDVGPLDADAIAARTASGDAAGWIEELRVSGRIIEIRHRGQPAWAAVEDAARLRDALGTALPPGIPEVWRDAVPDPLGDVLGRYARTHGPFTTAQAATALGLPDAAAAEGLQRLEAEGRVASGAFRPGGGGREWVDNGVLRRLRRRSLAVLRHQVEAVEAGALVSFLPAWQGVGDETVRPDRLLEVVRRLQGASLPASILETDVLPARMRYEPQHLDALLAAGTVCWVGAGSLGARDGRIRLYLRDQVPLLHDPGPDSPDSEVHAAIREHLAARGASFFPDLYRAAGGGDPPDVLESLWDLVWAGEVTNDTFAPLRAFVTARRSSAGKRTAPSLTPPTGSGRWYLVSDLVAAAVSPEERARSRAEQLLDRAGIATRPGVLAEGVPGGFAGLYPVLAAMEDTGRVRRGYFIEGLGGAQFALPGAIDRLRNPVGQAPAFLAAADPANPYGAALPWPDHETGQAARTAATHVLFDDGRLIGVVSGRRALTFDADPSSFAAALHRLASARLPRMIVSTIDGTPATASPWRETLEAAGFVLSYKGLAFRKR
jgi:ATP-dependent Lhr-like helicase